MSNFLMIATLAQIIYCHNVYERESESPFGRTAAWWQHCSGSRRSSTRRKGM